MRFLICSRKHIEKEANRCDEILEASDLISPQEEEEEEYEEVEVTSDENDSVSSDEEGGMGYMFEVQNQVESTEKDLDMEEKVDDQFISLPTGESVQNESFYASQCPPSNEEVSSFCHDDGISDEALLRLLESFETTGGGSTLQCSHQTPGNKVEEVEQTDLSHHSPAYPSPYLQPFTPSKKSTPGKYLYLPTLDTCPPLSIPESFPEISQLKANTFSWRHTADNTNCLDFLTKLRCCKCISFELVFDSIPFSPGGLSYSVVSRAWAPMVSWRRSLQGSKGSRGGSDQLLSLMLVGISICFGDEVGYYLPLPKIPPLLSVPILEKKSTTQSLPNNSLTLSSLPESTLIMICRFVGFGKILHKSLGLYPPEYSQRSHESNPLLTVSKKWAELSRRCLRYEWMRGQCLEWRLLGKIMNSSSITKVSSEMKDQLICLRERDVILNGFIEDPTIARSLLEIDETNHSSLPSTKQPSSSLHSNHLSNIKEACFKAISVFRTMGELENTLKSNRLWSTFLNIEMPLCYTVADAELNGIPIDSIFWTDLRQDLTDRVKMIEYFFRETQGMNFNLSNPKDISQLKCQIGSAGTGSQSTLSLTADENGLELNSDDISESESTPHLLLQLVQEWRSHSRILPLCNLILQNRCRPYGSDAIDRTRGKYHSIGTETGRLIITSPPLQQVPHSCTYLPSLRESLHKELQRSKSSMSLIQFKNFIQFLNQKAVIGEAEWVRVTKMRQPIVSSNLHVSSSSCQLYSDNGMTSWSNATSCTTGKLVAITSTPINQFVIHEHSSTPTLFEMWRGAGFPYQEQDGRDILGVMVNINNKIFSYPADQVFRLQAPIVPDHTEVTQVKLSSTKTNSKHPSQSASASTPPVIDTVLSRITLNPRDGFRASPGCVFIASDYSQIELRIFAHFAMDPKLYDAFIRKEDIFLSIASQWKSKSISDISQSERNAVKQLCYALLYGAGPHKVAVDAHCTVHEAELMIQNFLQYYSGIQKFISEVKKRCRTNGFVETMLGRKRHLPKIRSVDRKDRARAERQAVNTVCQGSAADLIKVPPIPPPSLTSCHISCLLVLS